MIFLGTILDFDKNYHANVNVTHCQEAMAEDFLEEITPSGKAPQSDVLLKTGDDSLLLSEKNRRHFARSK